MKRIILISSVSLLFGATLLPSCSKDHTLETPKTKENTWYWGFFEGYVNGKLIDVVNDGSEKWPIRSIRMADYPVDGVVYITTTMCSSIFFDDRSKLEVTLCDLVPGERYVKSSVRTEIMESSIKAIVYNEPTNHWDLNRPDDKPVKGHYIPSADNPFRIVITDVIWLSPANPIIEVQLDGVLYNRDDPQDTIIFFCTYGAR